ncbi:LysR substrate-binding domain-containing protein [Nakamurella leprariae]|uniref:LysR family transcriptional regulator n=1 Tax=Nakamurella leprariae TaxID=2803911 RepID=A0A938YDI1_9ACTN|nr:LysR substrate-binding domain-containing protein [Nakamurella leprariae]MBM9467839.1 LysR family transcriptional regulator [Nakamurella leprariae]
MELRHLRSFVAVAEERHFGRAAARLHIAQPPLSQQIRTLEAELGVQLLLRTTRRVELTPAGAAFLTRVRTLLQDVDDAVAEARQVAAGSIGRLAVGCVGSVTYSLLPALARHLSDELPGIEFAFRGEMLVPDQVAALRAGDIDVALLRPPVHDPAITLRVLRSDELVLAVPADHPLADRQSVRIGDLRDARFIVHSGRRESVMYDQVRRWCRDAGFEPVFRHQVDETSTLVTLVAGGLGVAIVPAPVMALTVAGVAYRPIKDARRLDLAVAWRTDRDEPHLLRAVEAVEQHLGSR